MAPAKRARAGYVLGRSFAFGQGPTRACLRRDPPDRLGAAGWMAVGALQAALYGAPALVLRALARPAWLPMAVKAMGGLGKVSPWKTMNFYGAAMLAPAPASPRRRGRPSPTAIATSSTQVNSL